MLAIPGLVISATGLSIGIVNAQDIQDIQTQPSGNLNGPFQSTSFAICTYANTIGTLLENAPLTISQDSIRSVTSVINMSQKNTLNFQVDLLLYNQDLLLFTSEVIDVNNNIAIYTSKTSIAPSSILSTDVVPITELSTLLLLNGSSIMSGSFSLGLHSITNGTSFLDMSIADTINLVATNVLINGISIPNTNGFLLTSGANSMLGNLNVGGHSLINVTNVILTSGINPMTNNLSLGLHNIDNGTSHIDMTNANTINFLSTNLEWNANPLVTPSDLNGYLRIDGTSIMTGSLQIGLHLVSNGTSEMDISQSNTINLITTNLQWNGTSLAIPNGFYLKIDGTSVMTGDFPLGLHTVTNGTSQIDMTTSNTIDLMATNVFTNGSALGTVLGASSSTNHAMASWNGFSTLQNTSILFTSNTIQNNGSTLDLSVSGTLAVLAQCNLLNTTNFNGHTLLNTNRILPATNRSFDFGQSNIRYRDLYLGGNLHNTQQSIWDSVNNQIQSVAPAGQRDFYQNASSPGAILSFFNNIVYASGSGISILTNRYSTNGGITFQDVVFDVVPNGIFVFGYNGSSLFVAVPGFTDSVYTSTDGIHFTAHPNTNNIAAFCINVQFAFGLFMIADPAIPTQCVVTSPDGINWTRRTTPNVGSLDIDASFAYNPTLGVVVVATTSSQNSILYSTDGILWQAATGGPNVHAEAVCYNADRNEFILQDANTLHVYHSTNGAVWTDMNILGTAGAIQSFWVSKYQRYYMPSVMNTSFVLFQSNGSSSFVSCQLHVANNAASGFNMALYVPTLDRFLMGTDDSFIGYGTATPYDINATSNNIRVLGMPVSCAKYNTLTTVNVNNTISETVVSLPSSFIGTLFFMPIQPNGSNIHLKLNFSVTSSSGDTLTLRYYTNGSTLLFSHILTVPSSSSNLIGVVQSNLVINSTSSIRVVSVATLSGHAPLFVSTTSSNYHSNNADGNTLSISAQWGANTNQFTMNQLFCFVDFPNGS